VADRPGRDDGTAREGPRPGRSLAERPASGPDAGRLWTAAQEAGDPPLRLRVPAATAPVPFHR
jgi:hypothetical protein